MRVTNVHRRRLTASPEAAGALLDGLASPGDVLWPRAAWPPMRLSPGLAVGASGGHGPIRYTVEAYEPGRLAQFRFTGPRGFDGFHRFTVEPGRHGEVVLEHVVEMRAHGSAIWSWLVVFRPLHDALVENVMDRAEVAVGTAPAPRRWSPWVRLLRRAMARGGRSRRARPAAERS